MSLASKAKGRDNKTLCCSHLLLKSAPTKNKCILARFHFMRWGPLFSIKCHYQKQLLYHGHMSNHDVAIEFLFNENHVKCVETFAVIR